MTDNAINLILMPFKLAVSILDYIIKKVIGLVVLLHGVVCSILETVLAGAFDILEYVLDTINEIFSKRSVLLPKRK